MNRLLIIGVAVLAAAGCQAPAPKPPMVWERADGVRMRGNSELYGRFQLDQTVCVGEVQKVAAGAAPVYYQGLFGAMAADQVIAQRQSAHVDIMKGCMAEKGYILVYVVNSDEVTEGVRKELR